MPSGIGASIITFSAGTTIQPGDVNTNFSNLNSGGVSNDSGTITTNGSGIMTLVGLIAGVSLIQSPGKVTQLSGSTSGSMRVVEHFVGPDGTTSNYLRLFEVRYSGYKNAAASANQITLNGPITTFALVFAGNITATQLIASGSPINMNAITSLGSTSAGSATSTSTLNAYSIAECSAFSAIKEPGSMSSTITGNMVVIGF